MRQVNTGRMTVWELIRIRSLADNGTYALSSFLKGGASLWLLYEGGEEECHYYAEIDDHLNARIEYTLPIGCAQVANEIRRGLYTHEERQCPTLVSPTRPPIATMCRTCERTVYFLTAV